MNLQVVAPGVLAATAIAIAAQLAAPHARIPAVMLAIVFGALAGNLFAGTSRKSLSPGLQLFTKKVLKVAIVLLGLKFTAEQARNLGGPVITLIGACLVLALMVAAVLARPFGVTRRIALLLGCGTAICGATAVVTIAPLVKAEEDEVAFSIATIFLFNVVALFAFPYVGRALGLGDLAFGAWVGTSVNDTAAVVATGHAYSEGARAYATAIKLIRTLALVPMAIVVATSTASLRRSEGGAKLSLGEVFPWFVLGFAIVAALGNLLDLPKPLVSNVLLVADWMITGVLAAVGLNLDAKKIFGSGARSLALGFAIAVIMAGASLALVRVLAIGL
jgi:uncharacterized integral membrane protein (TIGR00698 family)